MTFQITDNLHSQLF